MFRMGTFAIVFMAFFASVSHLAADEHWGRFEYTLSEEEEMGVRQFIVEFDEKPVKEFMKDLREKSEGAKVETMRLLKYIAFIFSDQDLRARVQNIMDSKGKANVFLTALRMEMDNAKKEGKFEEFLSVLIEMMRLDREIVQSCLDRRSVRELVHYLLQR